LFETNNRVSTIPRVCWKVDGTDRLFKKLNSLTWIELYMGRQIYSFDFVYQEEKNDTVILYSVERKFYLRISASRLTIRKNLDFLNETDLSSQLSSEKELYKGSWIDIQNNEYTFSQSTLSPYATSSNAITYQYYGYFGIEDEDYKAKHDYINEESLWQRQISSLSDNSVSF